MLGAIQILEIMHGRVMTRLLESVAVFKADGSVATMSAPLLICQKNEFHNIILCQEMNLTDNMIKFDEMSRQVCLL